MSKEKRKIVLIVDDVERQNIYNHQIVDYGNISLEHFKSAREFRDSISMKSNYCGFIVDLRTLVKTTPEDKAFLYELKESFPIMHISHSLDRRIVKGNIGNHSLQDKKLFDYFFNDLCPRFNPRGIRAFKRKNLYLNVYLSASPGAVGDESIKANTSDISEGGCFIITSQDIPLDKTREIYMVPKELTDQRPILCMVKWVLPWGAAIRHLPGIGVAFKEMSESQKEEIRNLLRKTYSRHLSRQF